MKLASFSTDGRDRLGLATPDGNLVDLADALTAADAVAAGLPTDMIALIEEWDEHAAGIRRAAELVADGNHGLEIHDAASVDWHPPVRRPTKICCIALNNRALDRIKVSAPPHPAFFIKPSTALVGHRQAIRLRKAYGVTHPEPELAVVIGQRTKDVAEDDAMDAVFGYSVHNDVTSITMRSEDSFHFRFGKPKPDGTFEFVDGHTSYAGRYKGSDTFCALGPWIATRDEIADPHALTIRCELGDKLFADESTGNLTHSVAKCISFISQFQTLTPGDVVSMGTAIHPDGEDKTPLSSFDMNAFGDEVTITISGIGTLRNPISRE